MERLVKTYKEYWGYQWRITRRHQIPGIFKWDEDLVNLVEKVCELNPGAEVLDLGCAGGDQLKLFAKKGYKVMGIDYVPVLIDYAHNVFYKEELSGELVVDDMRNIAYQNCFDLVTMFSGTFGYSSDEGNNELLKKIYRALKPGGKAFIDYLPFERYYSSAGHKKEWHEIDGGYHLSEVWFDVPSSTRHSRSMDILLDGRIIAGAEDGVASEVLRCYTAREMEILARNAGFSVIAHLTRNHIDNPEYQPKPDEPRGMIVLKKGTFGNGD